MTAYTRQSTFSTDDDILAADHNNEYNALVAAFDEQTGHAHDGTTQEGPVIGLIGDAGLPTPLNKVLIDTVNDNIGFWVDVASSSVEQVIIQDGAILPVTDNDVDLGSAAKQFKNLYLEGAIVGTFALDSGTTIGTLTLADGSITDSGGSISFGNENLSTTGTLTASGGGALTGTWTNLGTVTTVDINGGTIDGAVIGGASAAAITGTTITASSSFVGTLGTAAQPNVTSLGTLTTLTVDNITVNGAAITSDTGAISFDNENLTTTGTLAAGATTITGNATVSGALFAGTTSMTASADADNLLVGSTSGNNGLTIQSVSTGTGNIFFSDTNTTGVASREGQIIYNHSTGAMSFATAQTTALTIDSNQDATFSGTLAAGATTVTGGVTSTTGSAFATSSGNVGIGIASGSADGKLHVHSGSAGAVTANSAADDLVVEKSASGGISILVPDGSLGSLYFGTASSNVGAAVLWDYTNSDFYVGTNKVGASTILRGDNAVTNLTLSGASGSELATFAGTVRIDPASGGASLVLDAQTNQDPTLTYQHVGSTVGYLAYDTSASDITLNNSISGTNADIRISTSDGAYITEFKGNGAVNFPGLITLAGSATIASVGTGTSELILDNNDTGGRQYNLASTGTGYGSTGNFIVYDVTVGAERFRIDSNGDATFAKDVTITEGKVSITDTANETALSITSSLSTTNAIINLSAGSLTTGDLIRNADADNLTTGSLLVLDNNSADTSTRSLIRGVNNNPLATGATVLYLQQDSVQPCATLDMNGDGIGLYIDSVSTTQPLIDLNNTSLTTGIAIRADNFNSLTTGVIAYFHSNSSDTSGRQLVQIHNDNTLATGAIPLQITQDASETAVVIDQNGNASALTITSDATTQYVMNVGAPTTAPVAYIANQHASTPRGIQVAFTAASPDDNSSYFFYGVDSTTDRIIIWSDGDIVNHDNSYGAISDARLKQDITPVGGFWDKYKQVEWVEYKHKTDVEQYGDDAKEQLGVIAQDLREVFPSIIKQSEEPFINEDGEEEEGEMGVKYSVLYAIQGKVLQEAMARIEELEAKVEALS